MKKTFVITFLIFCAICLCACGNGFEYNFDTHELGWASIEIPKAWVVTEEAADSDRNWIKCSVGEKSYVTVSTVKAGLSFSGFNDSLTFERYQKELEIYHKEYLEGYEEWLSENNVDIEYKTQFSYGNHTACEFSVPMYENEGPALITLICMDQGFVASWLVFADKDHITEAETQKLTKQYRHMFESLSEDEGVGFQNAAKGDYNSESTSKTTCPSCGDTVSNLKTDTDAAGASHSWCSSCWRDYWDIMG